MLLLSRREYEIQLPCLGIELIALRLEGVIGIFVSTRQWSLAVIEQATIKQGKRCVLVNEHVPFY